MGVYDSDDLLFLRLGYTQFHKFSEQGVSKGMWSSGAVCPDCPGNSDQTDKRNGRGTR